MTACGLKYVLGNAIRQWFVRLQDSHLLGGTLTLTHSLTHSHMYMHTLSGISFAVNLLSQT